MSELWKWYWWGWGMEEPEVPDDEDHSEDSLNMVGRKP